MRDVGGQTSEPEHQFVSSSFSFQLSAFCLLLPASVMATYLVTGAAGFIASKVCEQLLAAGHRVVGVDNLNDYYDVRLKDWRLSTLLNVKRSELDADSKHSAFAGVGRVFHNAPGSG